MPGSNIVLPNQGVFAGADMVAAIWIPTIKSYKIFGEISTVSYSVHREFWPVRGLGTINPKGFVRGPRTIAGSLIFTVFDRHVLYEAQYELSSYYSKMLEENLGYANNSNIKFVTDEIPPFDIIISMMNERDPIGASIRIYGIRISDEGQTMSINDLLTENVMRYLATDIDLMTPDFTFYNVDFNDSNYFKKVPMQTEQKETLRMDKNGLLWGK